MNFPLDYEERVYAGILGKIIGVYLGRPVEGWSNQRIENELGETWFYVHEQRGVPLIVADDDISGTFSFVRAFADNNNPYDVTPEQIGNVWRNLLIENKTVLWWGGMGNSTEHTAWLRLSAGIKPPRSGSAQLNGIVVSEQIGAQIFIDGWAMLCPGDPDKAAALARKAASVSHDGEAIYGAQVIAAMEAQAFVESDRDALLDCATTFIPHASTIYSVIQDLREWHADDPRNWRATLRNIEAKYGYDRYGGGCHMVPNHALILLGLLYGDDDFQKSLMITNTAGWDTDCNAANIGCLMGIKNGLANLTSGVDFRTSVADKMYLPTADGGRCITDAARETYFLVNAARATQGLKPLMPNGGQRFHFALPGSLHGFTLDTSVDSRGAATLENNVLGEVGVETGSAADERALAIRYRGVGPGRVARVMSPTFFSPEALAGGGYGMVGCPTLYPGQILRGRLVAAAENVRATHVCPVIKVYGRDDKLEIVRGETIEIRAGESGNIAWQIPDTDGFPIADVGVEVGGHSGRGTLFMDWLGWSGAPDATFCLPENAGSGRAWKRAFVDATQRFEAMRHADGKCFRILQDRGTGYAYQGESHWTGYTAAATGSAHLADAFGMVVCARGLRRHVSVQLTPDGAARLIQTQDDFEVTLADASIQWDHDRDFHISITVHPDGRIVASVDDGEIARFLEGSVPVEQAMGAAGFFTRVGSASFGPLRIAPVPSEA